MPDGDLIFGLNEPLPHVMATGLGNALLVVGWCYHTEKRVSSLAIVKNSERIPVIREGIARPEIEVQERWIRDTHGYSLKSGFWCLIPVLPSDGGALSITLSATVEGGKTIEKPLGSITLVPNNLHPFLDPTASSVCVCMTTYNPSLALFQTQVESLKKQTFRDWICIVQDDHSQEAAYNEIQKLLSTDQRFHLFQNDTNVGFYKNFERCLERVPQTVEFIALCDQDDAWYPEKLQSCVDAFTPDTTLVFSDMHINDEKGIRLRETFWSDRLTNNVQDLPALFFANSVTGAASMFRMSLLQSVLPFPRGAGDYYHDWWIAKNALLSGKIVYIPEPLYAYVQHQKNAIGYDRTTQVSFAVIKTRWREFLDHHRWCYFGILLRYCLIAKILLLRHPDETQNPCCGEFLSSLTRGSFLLAWWHAIMARYRGKRTGGAEWRFPLILFVVWLYNALFVLRRVPFLRKLVLPAPQCPVLL